MNEDNYAEIGDARYRRGKGTIRVARFAKLRSDNEHGPKSADFTGIYGNGLLLPASKMALQTMADLKKLAGNCARAQHSSPTCAACGMVPAKAASSWKHHQNSYLETETNRLASGGTTLTPEIIRLTDSKGHSIPSNAKALYSSCDRMKASERTRVTPFVTISRKCGNVMSDTVTLYRFAAST